MKLLKGNYYSKLQRNGYFFIAPALIIFLIFLIIPMLNSFYLSFFQWNLVGEKIYVGLGNFIELFKSSRFWNSYYVTFKFTFLSVIIIMFLSFWLALALKAGIRFKNLGLQNSYLGLIIPEGLTAYGVFLMRQFMSNIPDEIIESARIDGASEFKIFLKIALPISKTAIFALIIFHAQWLWNVLLWPLIVISSPEMRTLPQAIALFTGVYFTPYPEQLAVSTVACLPILILFLFLSKRFIQGVALTGLKG